MFYAIALMIAFIGIISVIITKDIVIFAFLAMIASVICTIEENKKH